LQGIKVSNVLPGLGNAVDAAPWNARAWTYQERLFSNRKLYFCKEQVFFECDHGEYREDMLIDPHYNTRAGKVTYGCDPEHGTGIKLSTATNSTFTFMRRSFSNTHYAISHLKKIS
jgi:hypothetical protein